MPNPEKTKMFWVRSMFGGKTHEPIVVVTMPGGESVQMAPGEARDLALNILRCAEAAETDAFVVEWAMKEMRLGEHEATIILARMRAFRETRETRT